LNMTSKSEGKQLIITRELKAPLELVFIVWSEVQHLKAWWGSKGIDICVAELDFRPGGSFHYNMVSLGDLIPLEAYLTEIL